ncbi:MAG: hypothetical protein ACE5DK_10265, partial [Paracoccaceae bacterium]
VLCCAAIRFPVVNENLDMSTSCTVARASVGGQAGTAAGWVPLCRVSVLGLITLLQKPLKSQVIHRVIHI